MLNRIGGKLVENCCTIPRYCT